MSSNRVDRRSVLSASLFGGAASLVTTGASARAAASSKVAPPKGAQISTPADEVVETDAGRIRGYIRDGVHTFKGIPYAGPVSAAARFLPPRKPKPWTGVLPAIAYGPVCYQGTNGQWTIPEWKFLLDWDNGINGEDCLVLNVWTNGLRDGKKRPVMVWLHGGGYAGGSAQELASYDGENIARRGDVVLVSLNHRLNLFGFLNLAGVGGPAYAQSGNAGMLDIVAALEWVRDNIEQFGGDPGNVTVFGQSGGGGKVSTLLAMPSAKGLFHKAITQSGGGLVRADNRAASEATGKAVAAELGVGAGSLGKLAEAPVRDLQDALARATVTLRQQKMSPTLSPVHDDVVVLSGEGMPAQSAAIPFMFGNTGTEITVGIDDPSRMTMTETQLLERANGLFPNNGAAFVAEYRKDWPNASPSEIFARIGSAFFGGRSVVSTSELLTASTSGRTAPAYRWLFDWRTPVLDGRPGAHHCSEIAMVMNNPERTNGSAAGGSEAVELAHRISDAWIAFARTGDPNHPDLPRWKPLSAGQWPTMVFDARCTVVDTVEAADRRAFRAMKGAPQSAFPG